MSARVEVLRAAVEEQEEIIRGPESVMGPDARESSSTGSPVEAEP